MAIDLQSECCMISLVKRIESHSMLPKGMEESI